MISQRTRGLHNSLLLCQMLLVALAFWVCMQVAFSFFVGASEVHLSAYPSYGVVLILGLLVETMARDNQKISANLLGQNILIQHSVSVRQTAFAAGALLLYVVATKDARISRTVVALYLPALYLVLLWSNYVLPPIIARRIFGFRREERTLLIGSSATAKSLRQWLKSKELVGVRTIGIINNEVTSELRTGDLPRLGGNHELEKVLHEHRVTQVILLGLPECPETHEHLVSLLESRGARLMILNNLEERLGHPAVHFEDNGFSFLTSRQEPLENPVNRICKRMLDVSVALPIVMFVLLPVGFLTWLLQRFQSPGPVFFRQLRAGIQNRQFSVIKFRTMHVDNDDTTRQASQYDRRIYPAGRWLRRLNLDEIPQFLNVLKGEMSVVGPRPHMVEHNVLFAREMRSYHIRAFVKPGVTGLAQVRGFRGEIHSSEDLRNRLESDIYYLEKWELVLDLAIIFRTALQMLISLVNLIVPVGRRLSRQSEGDHGSHPPNEASNAPQRNIYAPHLTKRNSRQILGLRFFTGSAAEAVTMGMRGGLVVAPSAPVLLEMETDSVGRKALLRSDVAITDSGLMVLLWDLMTGEKTLRVSGLAYLKLLLEQPELHKPGATLWVMPSVMSMQRNLAWLQRKGMPVGTDDCYLAPQYGRETDEVRDPVLLELVRVKRPAHIIMAVGGGVQEKLGAYLLQELDYRPAVHCTGAAIGFLSGDQVRIPMWADRMRMGWFFRCMSDPAKFVPRYWESRRLVGLMVENQGRLPVTRRQEANTPVR